MLSFFFFSCIDCCNSLNVGLPSKPISKLQCIQYPDNITPILHKLHWLHTSSHPKLLMVWLPTRTVTPVHYLSCPIFTAVSTQYSAVASIRSSSFHNSVSIIHASMKFLSATTQKGCQVSDGFDDFGLPSGFSNKRERTLL